MHSPITGTAADVPFTALPPAGGGPAPLIVTWHMLDAPRSDAAFAAALPMHDLHAWRVHLGMPMCGARMVDGRTDAIVELFRTDPLMSFLHPFVRQATEEFPAALASLRAQLPVDDGPIGVLGGSLGGAVALRILADTEIPVFAGAVVNAAIRMRSVVSLFPGDYPYDAESEKVVDRLDFVAQAGSIAGRAPLLSSAASWITRRCVPTRSASSTRWGNGPNCCRSLGWRIRSPTSPAWSPRRNCHWPARWTPA